MALITFFGSSELGYDLRTTVSPSISKARRWTCQTSSHKRSRSNGRHCQHRQCRNKPSLSLSLKLCCITASHVLPSSGYHLGKHLLGCHKYEKSVRIRPKGLRGESFAPRSLYTVRFLLCEWCASPQDFSSGAPFKLPRNATVHLVRFCLSASEQDHDLMSQLMNAHAGAPISDILFESPFAWNLDCFLLFLLRKQELNYAQILLSCPFA